LKSIREDLEDSTKMHDIMSKKKFLNKFILFLFVVVFMSVIFTVEIPFMVKKLIK